MNSPLKIKREISDPTASPEKHFKLKMEKAMIPSFLEGFAALTEDDMDILAEYEEEQRRKGHFETLFPTRETIDLFAPYFDCQRHANLVLWQYIRQKCPI